MRSSFSVSLQDEAGGRYGGGGHDIAQVLLGPLEGATQRFGGAVVSAYHPHRSARRDGGSAIVPLGEAPVSPPKWGPAPPGRRRPGAMASVAGKAGDTVKDLRAIR